MPVMEWGTKSLAELNRWNAAHHYASKLIGDRESPGEIGYQTRIISDEVVSITRSWGHGNLSMLRSAEDIRRTPVSNYSIYYPIRQSMAVIHCGRETAVHPGEFVIISGDSPFRVTSNAERSSPWGSMFISLPSHMMLADAPGVEALCGRKLSAERGLGKLARDVFINIFQSAPALGHEGISNLTLGALKVIGEITRAESKDNESAPSLSSLHLKRVLSCVERNLSCRDLDVTMVAEQCDISRRYLHLIMARAGLSFASYVRRRRLEFADAWIRRPDASTSSLDRIAYSAGFKNTAHFARVYKDQYGLSPSAARRAAGDDAQR